MWGALAAGCNGVQPDTTGESFPTEESPERASETHQGQRGLLALPAPLAYWKFDDGCATTTVTDASGNGAHGTRSNGAGCDEDGRIRRAGSFDLTDDKVEVPDRPAFHLTNALTLASWVKPGQTLTGGRAILNKWYGYDSYNLGIWNGEYSFSIALPGGTWGVTHDVRVAAVPNQWAHVAGVYDGTSLRLYVNGVLRATKAVSGTLQQSNRPLVIGNNPANSGFGGLIDEVRLYNVALTQAQVQQLGQEVWPNTQSAANSDPWLAQNHEKVRMLRPTVLALNFVNAKDNAAMMSHLNQINNALTEGSRYHAYRDASAEPMLQYTIKPVDLRDASVPAGYAWRNSTKYPRENPAQGYWSFDYAKLFSQEFAQYYGLRAADGHLMDLCEAVNAGVVHEVWVYGDADVPDVSAAEVLELKPRYDANRNRIAGQPMDTCAGNGCFDDEDVAALPAHCTRSIRIGWVNNTRGPGCYSHSMGHGIESTGNRGLIPYFTRYFKEFADFNLDTRYGRPFESWYSCPYDNPNACLNHAASTCAHQELVVGAALSSTCSATAASVCASAPQCCTTAWDSTCVQKALEGSGGRVSYNVGTSQGTIQPYVPACQSIHLAPNSRGHYDDQSPQAQVSTCENFRMRNGPGGQDKREVFSTSKFSAYNSIAPDCSGGWVMYWMQSMPGNGNLARDDAGQPMLSWWPFSFY
ncbi:LamG domain protein jellyroll fold domain protein [Cystobacter fuscus DSM 2262]|uniref:LamG domain protein jellyroll fold domain protein n=1 Tax=Cystobacter fuscus (strain ATCC 25194 / DSM 2262 / NBRC 100088 / M29) TaxID=1242864 RepID=S9P3E3_CYSF2|nr:LamG domain protein jellyroll fold domain protein [Cystobacter fuscus DSM 2262]